MTTQACPICATCQRRQQRFEAGKWVNGAEGPRCPDCNRQRTRDGLQRRTT